MKLCRWLYDIEPGQEAIWGPEAVALSEVAQVGVPVLPSFCVSRDLYLQYFLSRPIRKSIEKILKGVTIQKPEKFSQAAKEIREVILKTPVPAELTKSVAYFLEEMEDQLLMLKGEALPLVLIAQGGSATELHLEVHKLADIEKALRQLFAHDFTEHLLFHRFNQHETVLPRPYAVLVQYSPKTVFAGTGEKYDPTKRDETTITVTVDHHEKHVTNVISDEYKIDAKSLLMMSKAEVQHTWSQKKSGAHTSPKKDKTNLHAEDDLVLRVAKLVRRAQAALPERHVFRWVQAETHLHLSRAIASVETNLKVEGEKPVLTGTGVIGYGYGPVRLITKASDWKQVEHGDVVVAEQVSPENENKLYLASALICETGHATGAEAHLVRDLGIPAVLGAASARSTLKQGHIVTVDGIHGAVYSGHRKYRELQAPAVHGCQPVIGTKLLAQVDDPYSLTRTELAETDGVGNFRGDFILRVFGMDVQHVLRMSYAEEYGAVLEEGMAAVARAAFPQPVLYQLHDTNVLAHHRHEPNALIGHRGTHRLLQEPEILDLELKAIVRARKSGHGNIHILLPMVRSVSEIREARKQLRAYDEELAEQIWIRCETPALTIEAEEVVKQPIAGILFDVTSLSSLITGVDHANYQIGHYHDQADEAVIQALRYAIGHCRNQGVASAITANMEHLTPEVVEAAVRSGVTAVVAPTSELPSLRRMIASIEQRLQVEHVISEEQS